MYCPLILEFFSSIWNMQNMWSVIDQLLRRNPYSWSPIISSTYGINFIQWVPGALSLWVKRPGREADHSSPSSAEVKECVELYLHSPLMAWSLVKHGDSFTFTFYGVNLETRIMDNILYVVGNSDIPLYLRVSFITLLISQYNNRFLPLLWHFSLIPNGINKFVDLKT
jgi:hypothetical protein